MQGEWGILIASADVATRNLLKEFLAVKGRRVLEAASDQECLRVARDERPKLILLDTALPGGDPAALRKKLQSDPDSEQHPNIVLFSGNGHPPLPAMRSVEGSRTRSLSSLEMFCSATLDGRFVE